ncbi:hypothetical protein CGCVW01_v005207 [Colletotrichum viniferum]|nr:hypothetical protein CGCVW01_v005207 [Colletotrichum viniferum]
MMTEEELATHKAGKERLRAEIRAQRAAKEAKEAKERQVSDTSDVPPQESVSKSGEKIQVSTSISTTTSSIINTTTTNAIFTFIATILSWLWSWFSWLLTFRIVYIPFGLFYFFTPALNTLHATLCTTIHTLQTDTHDVSMASAASNFALKNLCPSQASEEPLSYHIAPAPPVPRYGDALPNLAAWASHATDFTPLPPSAAAHLTAFEGAVRTALGALSSNQRAARNIAREKSAGKVRWFHVGKLNTPASAARARIGRLKIVFDGALRTFRDLVEQLEPGKVEETFGPVEATCGWKKALGKKEKALRGVGDGDADTRTGEVLAVVEAQGAVAGIACEAAGAEMKQLRELRGRLNRGVVPGLVELARAVRGVEEEAREKGGWATGADVMRWEEEVKELAVEFERVVKKAWDGWNGE